MKNIQINYLSHSGSRLNFSKKSLSFLKRMKKENKDKIKLFINYSNNKKEWENFKFEMIDNDIETDILYTIEGDYMGKIMNFIKSECEYSCSMDDDIMINEYLWDYIIENINVLDDPKNLFFAPLISNGIPTVDMFIKDFCDEEEQVYFYNLFKNIHIPNLWGVDYTSLNYPKKEWIPEKYYNFVSEINHYYKGIHPIRISFEGQYKLSEIIINKKEKFFEPQNYEIEILKRPYFCNSFYFIKTDIWKNIINDLSLFYDLFDEVPLNLYKDKHNLNMVFVKNGFCIHMAYNTITQEKQYIIEQNYNKII